MILPVHLKFTRPPLLQVLLLVVLKVRCNGAILCEMICFSSGKDGSATTENEVEPVGK